MQTYDKKQLAAIKTSVKRAGATVAEKLQTAIEMGLSFYRDHGNAQVLTEVVELAVSARSVNADAVKTYIGKHANVRWVVSKEKGKRFKQIGSTAEVTEPEKPWYEFTNQSQVKADLDPWAVLAAAKHRLTKAMSQGKVSNKEDAVSVVAALGTLLEGHADPAATATGQS